MSHDLLSLPNRHDRAIGYCRFNTHIQRDEEEGDAAAMNTTPAHDTITNATRVSDQIHIQEHRGGPIMRFRCVKSVLSLALLIGIASSQGRAVDAFSQCVPSTVRHVYDPVSQKKLRRTSFSSRIHSTSQSSALQMSANQFDVSKPVFDLFALRSIRGDALLQYNTLNQSEPLRINIYGLLAVAFFSAPLVSEAVGGETMGVVGTVGSTLAGFGSVVLFVNECRKRSKQLNRIEKELNAENLQVRLPSNALADMPYGQAESLFMLKKSSSPPRIIALCGTSNQLKEALISLCVLGRRLKQSSTFVVAVSIDGSTRSDWGIDTRANTPWLAEAFDADEWRAYFDGLSDKSGHFRWFGLNSNGRSFGSGTGEFPQWLQVLGQYLRPTELLDEDDKAVSYSDDELSVIESQNKFYKALTTGDFGTLTSLYSTEQSPLVSEVVAAGGRVDDWKSCLENGARPEGMIISESDAVVLSDTQAFSTVVEFPTNTGIDTATLLATQEWVRGSPKEEWKLAIHQTIPWNQKSRAQGTLLCDCRGCVALTRSVERRTFGGLIG